MQAFAVTHSACMTSTSENRAQQSLRNPREVLDSIPELLGFRPRESLCLLWLSNGFVRLVQRLDIRDDSCPDSLSDWAADVVWAGRHARADSALVIWISDSDIDGQLIGAVLRELREARIDVPDCIVTDGDGYFTSSLTGAQRWEFAPSPSWHLPEREALGYEADPDADIAPIIGPLDVGDEDAILAYLLGKGQELVVDERVQGALVLAALANSGFRDGVLWWVTEEPQIRTMVRDRLTALLPRVQPGFGADVAAVLAVAHWLDGDGARASMAVERGSAEDPRHRLIYLLGVALYSGLPPHLWREATADLTFQGCRSSSGPIERIAGTV